MVIQRVTRVAGCVLGALLLLGCTQEARAQKTARAPLEAGEGHGLGEAPQRAPGRVVFTLQEMPHVPTRSLEQMSAARLEPPGELTRDVLVDYLGLAAAEELRAEDRALRQKNAGAAGLKSERAEAVEARDFGELDVLSGAPLGAGGGDQPN